MLDIVATTLTNGGTGMAPTIGVMVTIITMDTATVGSALARSVLESP